MSIRVIPFSNPNPNSLNSPKSKINSNFRVRVRACARINDFEAKFSNWDSNLRVDGLFSAKINVNFRVCARIKDFEVKFANWDPSLRVYGLFSAPVKESDSKESKENEEKQNYYLNLGYAIRNLREEFPELFYRELSFDIYRDDIVFKDPLNNFVGLENYKSIFWALRFHGKLFFQALWVKILSVWQPMENVILVRWSVHGIPRVPWNSRGRFDGISEYKLDKNGKIYEHRVDNVILRPPMKFQVVAMEELILSLGCPSTPKPTCFEMSSSPVTKFVLETGNFTSLRPIVNSAKDFSPRREDEASQVC